MGLDPCSVAAAEVIGLHMFGRLAFGWPARKPKSGQKRRPTPIGDPTRRLFPFRSWEGFSSEGRAEIPCLPSAYGLRANVPLNGEGRASWRPTSGSGGTRSAQDVLWRANSHGDERQGCKREI